MSSADIVPPSVAAIKEIPPRYAEQHKREKMTGPGDARPTALQIVKDEGLLDGKSLKDLTVLITGCSSGIGIETARAIYETGAKLFITARTKAKGEPTVKDIIENAKYNKSEENIEIIELELDDLSSVKRAAEDFRVKSNGKLNILINNAGIMACPQSKTKDGFESQFGTNHLGHFYLFQLLKDLLLKSSTPKFQSRVISLASMAHLWGQVRFDDPNFEQEGSYNEWAAYGQAKTANIYFASEVERRYGSKGLHALSLHPG